MSLDTAAYVEAFRSHLLGVGLFDDALGYEPKDQPKGPGILAAVWVDSLVPTTQFTGLAATSTIITFTVRLYVNMLREPQEDIDRDLMAAVDRTCAAISGDFTLGDHVDHVDLLGIGGQPMAAVFGYVSLGGPLFRTCDITVPVVIGDTWAQAR